MRADIITSKGHHRGMGTVEFTNTRDVDEAIRQYDGSYFMDRSIFVRQDNPPPESKRERFQNRRTQNRNPREDYRRSYTVRVENLPFSINWQALKDMFKECGEVSRADIDVNAMGQSTGTGEIVFPYEDTMRRAIEKYNNYEIEGKTLKVCEIKRGSNNTQENTGQQPLVMSTTGEEHVDSDNKPNGGDFTEGYVANGERNNFIFCSNLPESTARSDLFDLFGTIGSVSQAELRYDPTGNPTGIAVVQYADISDADTCITRLNNYNYGGCDLNISYAKKS